MSKYVGALVALAFVVGLAATGAGGAAQGQSNDAFAASYASQHVTSVAATTQRTSCYRPELSYDGRLPDEAGYRNGGSSACPAVAPTSAPFTGEDQGPYETQDVVNPSLLVKDHSESDIRVDPKDPNHLIGQSKWIVNAEGYNHLLGFYESFDGGQTWPVQGHVPGYEGWTDNTDPVGSFDPWGNFYSLVLPYQFYYDKFGSHKYANGSKQTNPSVPAEAVAVSVHPAATVSGKRFDTYLLPHVAPDGTVWTTTTLNPMAQGLIHNDINLVWSTDGGATWQGPLPVADDVITPAYANTTFREGIVNTFAVGPTKTVGGFYPLYVAYEDGSSGLSNIYLTASYDGGRSWTSPLLVNDNVAPVDELQPNLGVAPNGTVSVAFYDRRLACPTASSAEAAGSGITFAPGTTSSPGAPWGRMNYCVNTAVQFYSPNLTPIGQNVRLSAHTWDPQLSAPHTS